MAGIGIGGMPTDVDVERLRQEIGVPTPGDLVTYAKLEEVLKLSRHKARFRTVIMAWRKKLDRENNVLLKAVPNSGFEAMDSHARVDHIFRLWKGGVRRIHRGELVAIRTDRHSLDAEEQRKLDHFSLTGAQVRLLAATAARQQTYHDPQVKALTGTQG